MTQFLHYMVLLQAIIGFTVVIRAEMIYITPVENASCITVSSHRCITLSEYANTVTNDADTLGSSQELVLMPGNHTLNTELLLTNVSLFSMTAIESSDTNTMIPTAVTITCAQASRFLFQNVTSIHISGLHFFGCNENLVTNVNEFNVSGSTFNGQDKNGTGLCMYGVKSASVAECSFQMFKGSIVPYRNHSIAGGAIVANNSNLVIKRCAFHHNSANLGGALFGWCSNMTFSSCTFSNNTASVDGGVMYIWSGVVAIDYSIATRNVAKRNGGVVHVTRESLFTIEQSNFTSNEAKYGGCVRLYKQVISVVTGCIFSNNVVKGEAGEDLRHYGGALCFSYASVSVFNSTFHNNSASYVGGALYSKYGILSLVNIDFYSNYAHRGGALFVANSTTAVVQDTLFTYNEASYDGGAVWTQDCYLTIQNTQFVNNSALLASAIRSLSSLTSNEIAIFDTSFIYNYANFSTLSFAQNDVILAGNTTFWRNKGSLFVYSSNMTVTGHANFSQNTYLVRNSSIVEGGALSTFQSNVFFNGHVSFTNNTADYGGALFITESEIFNYGQLLIANNTALVTGGGIYAFQSGLNFKTSNGTVTQNKANEYGGGLFISSSIIRVFGGSLEIVRNSADKGGGASFNMNGKLYVIKDRPECFKESFCNRNEQEWIRLDFVENVAQYGGAIYVADDSNSGTCTSMPSRVKSTAGEECFFQGIGLYSFQDNSFMNFKNTKFIDNVAGITGDIIYGGLLDRCSVNPFAEVFENYNSVELYTANSFEYLENLTNINNGSVYREISSDAVRVCFCYEDQPNCSYEMPTVYVKKGKTFRIPAVAVNQINSTVEGVIRGALNSGDGAVSEGEYSQQTRNVCTDLSYTLSSPNPTEQLVLFAEGPCKDIGISKRLVTVSFLPCVCPVGFMVPQSSCLCECDPKLYPEFVSSCSIANRTVQRKDNVWISYVNETNMKGFVTYHFCPYDYCYPVSKEVNVNLNTKDGSDAQCAYSRSKVLCGECKDGLSLTLGSSACKPCSNNYLLLLGVFAFAGIALVILLLACNLTVAVGTINGPIFYANIIAGNRASFVPFQKTLFRILALFIAWLNLDFGIETCFYDGLNGYVKTWLQLVFPVYIVFLVIVVIILCERSKAISNFLLNRDPVATLATLLLLSYTKILRVIIDVFSFATIDYPDGSSETVWLFDANIRYLEAKHIPLFAMALVILVIGFVYTIFLFSWKWLQMLCSEKKGCKWMTNSKLFCFINPYFAPYDSKHYYWTGLLLLVRLLLYVISAVNVFGDPSVNLLSILVLTLLLLFLKERYVTKVYKNWLIDTFESSYILNLVLFSGASLYVRATHGKQEIVSAFSLSIAFLTFIVILCYHIYEYILTKHKDKLLKYFINRRANKDERERTVTLLGGNNLAEYYNTFSGNDESDDTTNIIGGGSGSETVIRTCIQ